MKRRTLIRTLELPKGSDARALAESLTDDFNVASISSSNGEYEVQLVSPAELVVVITPSKARFFLEPLVDVDDDDDEHDDEDDDDDPDGIAEEMSFHLARRVGLLLDEDDGNMDDDSAAPDDHSDEIARRVVARLLDEGLLELVTPRSRPGVEAYLAHRIAHGRTGETLCDDLADAKGVAEVYASNEQFAEILKACRRTRAAAPTASSARERAPAAQAKAVKTGASKGSTTDKPKAGPSARKSARGKK